MKNEGYKVTFIAPYCEYSEKLKKDFDYIPLLLNTKGTNVFEDIKTFYHLYKIYRKLNPKIILHFAIKPNIYGTLAAKMLSIPSINNIAGLGSLFIDYNFKTKLAKYLYKISQKRATKVFFQNKDDLKLFLDEGIIGIENTDRLPGSGVDLNKFKEVHAKKDSKKFKFLLVSRMLWPKGIEEFVHAAKIVKDKFKNVEFLLLGFLDTESPTAISKEQMDIWIENYPIKYLGVSDNVKEVISIADCIVLPSYYREGVPKILLESASMSKPIITTHNVGCKEVVDHGVNGYLCQIKNVDDLVIMMKKILMLDPDKLKKMGERGREKVEQEFDENIVLNKYVKSIEVALK